ncbi:D-alanyl-D-alanine carboxypeptidase family protein [Cohnella faecalis]|uniref:D-alanyl-D-alanine carboxypeptidase n=1 Tax=Cohnella faecalis TaxID=2315694 RepID=A0A398CQ03_9BACL|nr:D-alanyl-D-alanine carboxypeptidase family protein [Cohnella faecalis]RIE04605.1 D-alanyl-D-alanine carboxypeptidase [Cohnella faecalis]
MRTVRISRVIAAALSAFVLTGTILSTAAHAEPANAPQAPENHARGAALVDVESGRVLYSKRGDSRMLIASLTKIMTAIVAIEHGKLADKVTVSTRAAGKEGSSIYLKAGEKMTLQNMLYGLMLRSGNDAAVAVAEHVGGSLDGFVYMMNKKAEELGLSNSHFANPSGLDQEGHFSSAVDLAKLTAYALHNPVFREIVKTRVKSAPNPHEDWDYKWVNKNKMLTMYEGADGVKTGYTKQSLRTLVSSATRNGQQLVAVTLNDGDDWADHRRLLDYGFLYYPLAQVVAKGQPVNDHPYAVDGDFRYPFAKGERERLRIKLVPFDRASADYLLGKKGRLRLMLDGREIGSVDLTGRALADEETGETPTDAVVHSASAGRRTFYSALQECAGWLFFGRT